MQFSIITINILENLDILVDSQQPLPRSSKPLPDVDHQRVNFAIIRARKSSAAFEHDALSLADRCVRYVEVLNGTIRLDTTCIPP